MLKQISQIQMPESLTLKDIESIVYVYGHMSVPTKHTFLAGLMVGHPNHFLTIVEALGDVYYKSVPRA